MLSAKQEQAVPFSYVINSRNYYILTEQIYVNSDEILKGETPKCTQMKFLEFLKF